MRSSRFAPPYVETRIIMFELLSTVIITRRRFGGSVFSLYPSSNAEASSVYLFFFNDTGTTEIYTLSLHDALPISRPTWPAAARTSSCRPAWWKPAACWWSARSEEHTSELQSLAYLVCRLLLEKKKKTDEPYHIRKPDKKLP